jgi:tetratricopeptide (TPR) repeat protein
MPDDEGIEPGFVEELLGLPARDLKARLLRERHLLDAGGLGLLLDAAETLLDADPGKARRLAELCAGMADGAGAPAAVPRADYIRAGAHSLNGEFHEDLRLTEAAREGYAALGMNLEALRTNVGKMAVLIELGRYEEALEAGRVVLDALEDGSIDPSPTREQYDSLAAPVHLNRGGCYEYMGRYDEALDAYAAAKRCYRALGLSERIGEVLDNEGAVLASLGRGTEALEAHEQAVAIFAEAGLDLSRAKAINNVGETRLRQGSYTAGLDAFEQARRLLVPLDASVERSILLRNTADAYLGLNLYLEALAGYREANDSLGAMGMAHDRAQALWGMGSALMNRAEFEPAEEALAEAANLFAKADNAPLLSGVMLELASLRTVNGRGGEGLTAARRALALVSRGNRPVQEVYAHLRLVDLLLPDAEEAEPHLLEAQRLASSLELPQLRYRLHERFGRLRLLQGREEEARTLLEAAVEEIERLRGTVTQENMRASFLRDKTAAYEDLLRLHLAREADAGRAFAVAEYAKSRALVDLITGLADKEPQRFVDPEQEGRLRTLQADLNATYNSMLGVAEHGHDTLLPDLQKRAVGLETEIGRLRLQAAATSPDPFAARAAAPEDILEQVPPDVTLVAYHAVGDEVLAFVVSGGDVRVVRRISTVAAVGRLAGKLAVQWDRFRAGGGFAGRHAAMLERSTRRLLGALYGEVMAPLAPLLDGTGRGDGGEAPKLVVVPHGPMHQIPFHALFDGEGYFLERFEISYAPSATVYALCQERAPRGSGRALAFGVADPLIPEAAAEARSVAGHVPGARARVDEEATVAGLRAEAPGCDVLHLACHGLFRADNPMFSSLKLQDGWLTAADALGLSLPGALVTLSACESGRSGVIGGDEVLGLTRAFLGAGAATLVVSLWLAQDTTTAALMEHWYERMGEGVGRAAALRAAQLETMRRHPHPFYWAPFVLIGRR